MNRLEIWNQLQTNGLRAYLEIPEASCALASRKDTKQFKRFIGKQQGFTLDIGCGIQIPGYLNEKNLINTTGIDPLPAYGDFGLMTKIDGCGENIPLPDNWFDIVILAGTLDHVLDPAKVLQEARRVMEPSGRIIIQIGIPTSYPQHTVVTFCTDLWKALTKGSKCGCSQYYIQGFVTGLPVPDGCVDPFHFKYYTENEIKLMFTSAGLNIKRVKRLPGSSFYELRKE